LTVDDRGRGQPTAATVSKEIQALRGLTPDEQRRLNMKENQNIEWKSSWRDEYLKWICGFANAQGKPKGQTLNTKLGSSI